MKRLNAQNMTWIDTEELANLRAQLAQAQERVGELEKHREHEANIMDCLVADVAQRDAEIAELRKDREGLEYCLRETSANLDAVVAVKTRLSDRLNTIAAAEAK